MKTIISVFAALLTLYSCLPAQIVELNKKGGLAGPLRSLRYVNPYQTQVVLFDRQGNEIERTLYRPDGTIDHQVSHTYNADATSSGWKEYYGKGVANAEGLNKHAVFTYREGKLAEVIVYRDHTVDYKSAYLYDSRGNKIQEINSGPDAIFTSRNYKYDAADNLIAESSAGASYNSKILRIFDSQRHAIKESYFDDGVLKLSYTRTYENDRLTKEETVDPAGEITRSIINSYNSAGKLIDSVLTGENIISRTVIEYDEAGRIKQKETLTTNRGGNRFSSEDPAPGKVVMRYDSRGFEIERFNYSASGVLLRRQTSSIDERGKQKELVIYHPDGAVESKQLYEYDQYGNKVKTISVTISPQGEVQSRILEQSTITYY